MSLMVVTAIITSHAHGLVSGVRVDDGDQVNLLIVNIVTQQC